MVEARLYKFDKSELNGLQTPPVYAFMHVMELLTDLSVIPIEEAPPPLIEPLDVQIESLLDRMAPQQAVVLPASTAYLVLIKALGMGVGVALQLVPESENTLRIYRLDTDHSSSPFPRASVR